MIDLDRLEALAHKATPGRWWAGQRSHKYVCRRDENGVEIHSSVGRRDADFIAEARPEVVLELVAEIRRLRVELHHEANRRQATNVLLDWLATQKVKRPPWPVVEALATLERYFTPEVA